ncbi:MAG: hypothetical protein JSW54_04595 [Fidelibacterota bacterium]|nr:MAG: hypothetical protein JSW54_04595 [Candidatus Neomarinimicrobiota bacterium]
MRASYFSIKRSLPVFLLGAILSTLNPLSAQKPTLAIVDFEGFGISQTEAIALTNRLRNELFRLNAFNVVERGGMINILAEQNFQLTGCTSNDCLVELGQLLGAQQMLGGSISKVEDIITVSARLIDVETGRVLQVTDYDLVGSLRDILTQGMLDVAARLSGLDATEVEPQAEIVTPSDASEAGTEIQTGGRIEAFESDPRNYPIFLDRRTSRTFYLYKGQRLSSSQMRQVIYSSRDFEAIQLYNRGRSSLWFSRLFSIPGWSYFSFWTILGIGEGVPELGILYGLPGLIPTTVGRWIRKSAYKRLDQSFIRFNQLAQEQKAQVPFD